MPDSPPLDGQSRSRRTARPYVLAVVALAVLIVLAVAIAKPRTTAERAGEPVYPGDTAAQPVAAAPGPTGGTTSPGELTAGSGPTASESGAAAPR